jgi:hypothetical protein
MLPSNMLLLNLILPIDVTFSTPTGDYTHNPVNEYNGDAAPAETGGPLLLTHGRDVDHIRKFCPMVYGSLVDMTE